MVVVERAANGLRRCGRILLGVPIAIGLLAFIPRHVAADPQPVDPLAGNPRMMQNVRILAEGTPVSDLLALLSTKTGLDLTAHRDVADDKVIICGPTRPLSDVLSDLAALYNDTWIHTKTADGLDHYLLTRNRFAREYEITLALDIRNRMIKQLDAYIARAKSPEPYNYEVYRVAAQVLGLLSDEQKEQFLQRKSLNLPFGSLAPSEQLTAKQAVNSLYDADAAAADKTNTPYSRPPDSDLQQSGLRFLIQNVGSDAVEKHMHLFLTIGAAYSEDFGTLDDRIPWLLPSHGNPYTRKPVLSSSTIPSVTQIDLAMKDSAHTNAYIARLEALSEKSGMPLVADYYRCRPAPLPTVDPFRVTANEPARQALDQVGKSRPILWWIRGNTLLLRSRNWYTRRLYEVPDRWVLDLQKRVALQHGVPTYGDVIRLTELTQAQMAGLHGQNGPESSENTDGILGPGTDEFSLSGLPELLAIYKAQYGANSRMPVPKFQTNEPDLRRATITFDDLLAGYNYLVPAFIQAQPNAVSAAESGEAFTTSLTRGAPPTPGAASLLLTWTKGMYLLSLPEFPLSDRNYRTEAQLMP
jgi:hypothetical protein